MRTVRTLVAIPLAALAAAAVMAPAASAKAEMKAKYSGVVRKVNMGNHSFTLRLSSGTRVRIYVNDATRYAGVKNFEAIKKNLRLAVRAVLRESDHTWWATRVTKR